MTKTLELRRVNNRRASAFIANSNASLNDKVFLETRRSSIARDCHPIGRAYNSRYENAGFEFRKKKKADLGIESSKGDRQTLRTHARDRRKLNSPKNYGSSFLLLPNGSIESREATRVLERGRRQPMHFATIGRAFLPAGFTISPGYFTADFSPIDRIFSRRSFSLIVGVE